MRIARGRTGQAALALGLLLCAAACGSASTPTATATATAAPATPAPSSTPVPTPTPTPGLKPLELVAPTLGIDVVAVSVPCDAALQSLLPSGSTVNFADCGGYVLFMAGSGGPFGPVPGSSPDTPVTWANAAGAPFHANLVAGVSTLPRDPATGQYSGHGVGGPSVFLQLRDPTQARERGGPIIVG